MIDIPPSGFLWLAVLTIAVWRRSWLVIALVLSSVFQTMAVVNIGIGTRVNPLLAYYVVTSVLVGFLFLQMPFLRESTDIPRQLRPPLLMFAAFVVYAGVSLTFPLGFPSVGVYAPGLGYAAGLKSTVPARLSASMIAQFIYIALNFALFALMLVASRDARTTRVMLKSVTASIFAVTCLCLWQFAHRTLGLPYPSDLLYSAGDWALHADKDFSGTPRINGPFIEPSFAGAYLVGAFAFSLRAYLGIGSWRLALLTILVLIALLLTTSTTAYVALLPVLALFVYEYLLRPAVASGRLSKTALSLLVFTGVMLAVIALLTTLPGADAVLERSVTAKASSSSWVERTASDYRAIQILVETVGLGIGIGANLPSSFIAHLLSNVGLVGTVLFFGIVLTLTTKTLRVAGRAYSKYDKAWVYAALYGLWGHIIARSIAVPTTSFPSLWIWLLLVAMMSATLLRQPNGPGRPLFNGPSRSHT